MHHFGPRLSSCIVIKDGPSSVPRVNDTPCFSVPHLIGCSLFLPSIPRPCVGFYSIPSSPPVPPTIPRRPVTPNGVIALEQPMHKGSMYAAEWGE